MCLGLCRCSKYCHGNKGLPQQQRLHVPLTGYNPVYKQLTHMHVAQYGLPLLCTHTYGAIYCSVNGAKTLWLNQLREESKL